MERPDRWGGWLGMAEDVTFELRPAIERWGRRCFRQRASRGKGPGVGMSFELKN